jgi:hypothetical protein
MRDGKISLEEENENWFPMAFDLKNNLYLRVYNGLLHMRK